MLNAIVINENDNVAVVTENIQKNDEIIISEQQKITALNEIVKGHKVAIRDIKKGDAILKYNTVIGEADRDIKRGEWVHTHNVLDTTEKICDEYAENYRAKYKEAMKNENL